MRGLVACKPFFVCSREFVVSCCPEHRDHRLLRGRVLFGRYSRLHRDPAEPA